MAKEMSLKSRLSKDICMHWGVAGETGLMVNGRQWEGPDTRKVFDSLWLIADSVRIDLLSASVHLIRRNMPLGKLKYMKKDILYFVFDSFPQNAHLKKIGKTPYHLKYFFYFIKFSFPLSVRGIEGGWNPMKYPWVE